MTEAHSSLPELRTPLTEYRARVAASVVCTESCALVGRVDIKDLNILCPLCENENSLQELYEPHVWSFDYPNRVGLKEN